MPGLGVVGHAHFLHRAWRYRLRTERDELAYLRSLDLAGRTLVDIGAHRGLYTYWMSKAAGPRGRVVSFEPQPEMLEAFRAFQQSFHWIRTITLVDAGLSDTPGKATLRRVGDHTGGASLEPDAASGAPDVVAHEVRVTTLDAYFFDEAPVPAEQPVAFIKCDVEGHEQAVFRGGERLLREHRPRILMECHDRHATPDGVFGDLEALGYRGWFLHAGGREPLETLARRRAEIDRPYLNYVFEPA